MTRDETQLRWLADRISGIVMDADTNSASVTSVSGGNTPTEVASGTTTVNGTTVEEFVDIPTEGHYIVRGYPSAHSATDIAQGFDSGGDSIWLEYATAANYAGISEDQWVVKIEEAVNNSLTVEWAVYDLL